MAWPTTKANNAHLDASTDDPNLARPELKQNMDNVNDIIDFFPSGLTPLASQLVVLEMSGGSLVGGYNVITEHSDTGSNTAITDSSTKFTLTSGTWIMNHEIIINTPDTDPVELYNDTAGSNVVQSLAIEIGTSNTSIQMGLNNTVFTSNGSDKFAFKYGTYTPSNSADPRDGLRIKFTKIA